MIKEDQFTNILNSFGWIGLLVSMLKIDRGHDVLLIGESLCPVEVVAIFRCLVGSGHTGSFTVWSPNFSREQKRFDAICHICPNTHIAEEALINLLKDDGCLLVYKDDTFVSIFETISLQSSSFEFFVLRIFRSLASIASPSLNYEQHTIWLFPVPNVYPKFSLIWVRCSSF